MTYGTKKSTMTIRTRRDWLVEMLGSIRQKRQTTFWTNERSIHPSDLYLSTLRCCTPHAAAAVILPYHSMEMEHVVIQNGCLYCRSLFTKTHGIDATTRCHNTTNRPSIQVTDQDQHELSQEAWQAPDICYPRRHARESSQPRF